MRQILARFEHAVEARRLPRSEFAVANRELGALGQFEVQEHGWEDVATLLAIGGLLGSNDVGASGDQDSDRGACDLARSGVADEILIAGGAVGPQRDVQIAVLGGGQREIWLRNVRASIPPGG